MFGKLKNIVINNIGKPFLYYSGSYKMNERFDKSLGFILMLHRVLPIELQSKNNFNRRMEVTPQYLEKSIIYFKNKGYDIISLDRLYEILTGDEKPAGRFVCYTFDDGYYDVLDYALPVFQKYDMPFALYLTTGFPDNTIIPWWYLIEHLSKSEFLKFKHDSIAYTFELSKKSDVNKLYNFINHFIRNKNQHQSRDLFQNIFKDIDNDSITRQLSLSLEKINALLDYPHFTLGSHTANHNSLNALDEATIISEVSSAQDRINEMTGITPQHFSYPFGTREYVGAREFVLLNTLGFKTCVTTRQASILKEHKDYLHILPRYHFITYKEKSNALFKLIESGSVQFLTNKFKKFVTI